MSRTQNRFGDRLLMALVFLFLYAPIIILIVFSFNAGTSSSVWKGFSLKWYESLLSNRLIMNSVYTTLLVSLLSTIVASIAGTFAAIGLYAMSRRRRAAVNAVNNIPMMNADIVTGVSLCLLFVVFFNGWGAFAGWMNSWQSLVVLPERLTMGFGTLLIAHICFNIPYVILSVGPKLRQMDRNLIDAAQDLGCTWMQAFWRFLRMTRICPPYGKHSQKLQGHPAGGSRPVALFLRFDTLSLFPAAQNVTIPLPEKVDPHRRCRWL